MIRVLIAMIALLAPWNMAWATDRYIDQSSTGCSTPSDTDYNVLTRSCGTGTDLIYSTFTDARSAAVPGDNIIYRAGTYENMLLGTVNGAPGAPIRVARYQAETVTIKPSGLTVHSIASTAANAGLCGRGYWTFDGFIFDGSNQNDGYGVIVISGAGSCTGSLGGAGHHFTFINNEMKNYSRHAILINGDGHTVAYNKIHDLRSDCVPGNRYYGLYVATGNGHLIEHNEIYNTPGGYHQIYPGPLTNVISRYNYFHDNAFCSTASFGGVIGNSAGGTQFYNNIVVNSGSAPGSNPNIPGLQLFNTNNVLVRNNIFYGNPNGAIQITNAGAVGHVCENNIMVGNNGATIWGPGSCTQNTNKTTGVITDYVLSTTDFRLKSGSSAIDAGTARSGFAHNGSAPDIGAFESIGNPTASITANVMTLTFPMSTNVPIQNLSSTGISVSCTGSACPGSPSVNAVSRVVGTDSQVNITISGIAGNACAAANQNWTATYNSSTGSWTANDNIGSAPGIHQQIFSFTNLAATNLCTGSGPSGPPGTPLIIYNFNDGSGTTVTDSSGNSLHGTFTGSPTWGAGKEGFGMTTTLGTTQYTAIPYGSGINPSTQDLTIAFGVFVTAGQESASRGEFGSSVGTNQRFYIQSASGTWRLGIQGSSANATASNLAVTSGWNHLCLRIDSTADTATLHLNGVAGTGGAAKAFTSYTLSSNFKLGLYDINTAPGGTYDNLVIYTSLQNCATIYQAFQTTTPAPTGTLVQDAIQVQGMYVDTSGTPVVHPAIGNIQEVVANGAAVIVFQIHCANVADCSATSFKLMYRKNGVGTYQQVPNALTSDGTYMWGTIPSPGLNNGTRTTRLTGTCAVTNGTTQLDASSIPTVDLPQDGCVMLAYGIRVANVIGDYFEYKLVSQDGADLNGGYTVTPRLTVISPMTSAGF